MTIDDVSFNRIQNQSLRKTDFTSPEKLVSYMGAMQAQDYHMSKWAVGIRLKTATDKQIEAALDKGEIIRTHILRPTWHLAAATDIEWLIDLSAPQILALSKSRLKELEITPELAIKSNKLIEKALSKGEHHTREMLMDILTKEKIAVNENRSSHLLMLAELNKIVCNGAIKGKQQTYALFQERIAKGKSYTREEALHMLAKKYFTSHAPATLQDFIWWSGLSITDGRKAVASIQDTFITEKIAEQTYILPSSYKADKQTENKLLLLPAFDELVISYKDRTAVVESHHQPRTFSNNGIFRPTILYKGKVIGIWKRTMKSKQVIIEADYFHETDKNVKLLFENAAVEFAQFLNLEPKISA